MKIFTHPGHLTGQNALLSPFFFFVNASTGKVIYRLEYEHGL
jgi:hypothetical protein